MADDNEEIRVASDTGVKRFGEGENLKDKDVVRVCVASLKVSMLAGYAGITCG